VIVLAEQKKASVRVAFIGKKEAENLTYVSADYQAVSRVGGLDENLTVYIGQGKEPLTIRNIQELSAGAAGEWGSRRMRWTSVRFLKQQVCGQSAP